MVTRNIMVDMVIIIVVVMVVMVIRTDRTTMTHGTNKTDRVTRTHGTPKTDRIVRTRDRQDRQDRQVRDERQDRQILHLNLTFQVTCVGQLSQFLRCFLQCHLFPISSFDLLRVVSFWLCVISIFNCMLKVKATERIKAVRGGGEGRQNKR